MKESLRTGFLAFVLAFLIVISNNDASGGTFARNFYDTRDLRTNPVTVCFVGNAVSIRNDRVQQILDYLREFEYAANIRFSYMGKCPDPTTAPGGSDYYDYDFRIAIPDVGITLTGKIPGNGCQDESPASSWSNFPFHLEDKRSCLFNMVMGDDPGTPIDVNPPYLAHMLHESGHGFGLVHEHARPDVDFSTCRDNGFGWVEDTALITPYDRRSVMNYEFPCPGIEANYYYGTFSFWDRLTLHILYPEDVRVAEFVGTTVVRTTDTLRLKSAWLAKGANIVPEATDRFSVASDFFWSLDGKWTNDGASYSVNGVPAGNYTLVFSYNDFLGRGYYYSGTVRVLAPEDYKRRIAGPIAARLPLH